MKPLRRGFETPNIYFVTGMLTHASYETEVVIFKTEVVIFKNVVVIFVNKALLKTLF